MQHPLLFEETTKEIPTQGKEETSQRTADDREREYMYVYVCEKETTNKKITTVAWCF